MSFEIIWDPKALKFLDKLQKMDASRIANKVNELKEDPTRYTETLVSYDVYKLRVGDYRIFLDLDYNTKTILVVSIRHRKDAYKKK